MEINEEDYLQISGIQHYAFCPRQWGLICIEQAWSENFLTADGRQLHDNAHDPYFAQTRGDVIISRAMPVFSREMGVSGECDIVEFQRCEDGITLAKRAGRFRVYPVEYKRGAPKETDVDVLQLTAQAMCLEEMLVCDIPEGALYYGQTRHRSRVNFTEQLRSEVRRLFSLMHKDYARGHVAKAKPKKECRACSLRDICLPKIMCVSASGYNAENLDGEDL